MSRRMFLTGNNEIAITCGSGRSLSAVSVRLTARDTPADRTSAPLLTPGTPS